MRQMEPEKRVQHLRRHVQELLGDVDTTGLELILMVRGVANFYEAIANQRFGKNVISGPRWILLLRLLGEERSGNPEGVTPTYLSRCQNVSKNTISALLRGLEEQGLIQRELDLTDRRIFRIRLTDAGRQLIKFSAPQDILRMNALASGLSHEERLQLISLLGKLQQSLVVHSGEDGTSLEHPVEETRVKSVPADTEIQDPFFISA